MRRPVDHLPALLKMRYALAWMNCSFAYSSDVVGPWLVDGLHPVQPPACGLHERCSRVLDAHQEHLQRLSVEVSLNRHCQAMVAALERAAKLLSPGHGRCAAYTTSFDNQVVLVNSSQNTPVTPTRRSTTTSCKWGASCTDDAADIGTGPRTGRNILLSY